MHLLEKYANSMWFYVTCTIYAAIYNFMTVIAMLMYCGFYHICISCDLFAKILFKKNRFKTRQTFDIKYYIFFRFYTTYSMIMRLSNVRMYFGRKLEN